MVPLQKINQLVKKRGKSLNLQSVHVDSRKFSPWFPFPALKVNEFELRAEEKDNCF